MDVCVWTYKWLPSAALGPFPASLQHIDETFSLPQRREPRNEADVTAFTCYGNIFQSMTMLMSYDHVATLRLYVCVHLCHVVMF